MTEKEKALKVALLEKILREDFGIETRAQLVEACSKLPPLDISIFVAPVPSSPDEMGRSFEFNKNSTSL